MPVGRVGARNTLDREPGERGCRRRTLGDRSAFGHEFPPQPPGERAERQRSGRGHVEHRGAGWREREKHARGLVLVRCGGEDDLASSARHGERKHPKFVIANLPALVDHGVVKPGQQANELLRVEQRTAQSQVRPDAILQRRDHHDVELEPHGPRGCRDEHRV